MRPQAILISVLVILMGCAGVPLGLSVAVMPAPGKPFDLFVSEESICRHYAEQQVGISPQQATQNSTATGAVAGTALGAAAGGAIGAAVGHPGPGAAVGAGTGLLTGSALVPMSGMEIRGLSSGATTSPTSSACTPRATKFPAFPRPTL